MEAVIFNEIRKEGESSQIYSLSFTVGPRSFQIPRSYTEIKQFLVNRNLSLNEEGTSTLDEFAHALKQFFGTEGINVWSMPDVLSFLERSMDQAPLTRIQLQQLSGNMQSVLNLTEQFEARINGIESKMNEVIDSVALILRNQGLGTVPNNPCTVIRPDGSNDSPDNRSLQRLTSSLAVFTSDGKEQTAESDSSSDDEGDDLFGAVEDNLEDVRYENSAGDVMRKNMMHLTSPRAAGAAAGGAGMVAADGGAPAAAVDSSKPRPSVEELVQTIQALEEVTFQYQEEAAAVIQLIQPGEATVLTRASIFNMLRGQARVTINSSIFEYGQQEIGCNLPTDPLLISVLLSKNNFPHWHASLSERLQMVAEGHEDQWIEGMAPLIANLPTVQHVISEIEQQSDEHGFSLSCTIDNQAVRISSDRRVDLCMLAFIEEVANKVGKNHLLKRSLLLVRAWWQYEVPAYVNKDISAFLSPAVLTLMVCELFNKYHMTIMLPLQALALFIAEYCNYQHSMHIVTLQGLVKFDPAAKDPLKLIPPQPAHLISWEMTEKFWQLFHTSGMTMATGSSAGSSPASAAIGMGISSNPTAAGGANWEMVKAQYNAYYTQGYVSFQNSGFRVLHPFTHKSMMATKITPRRMNLITEAFQIGAMRMSDFLLQQSLADEQRVSLERGFFLHTSKRFGGKKHLMDRPVFESAFISSAVERIWQNILYCNFIMESIVTESAVLTAAIENLSIRGPLPVGEVGKILTEICGMANFTLQIKDKFGGLKKFLERFQEIFNLSNDHPFNPHIMLRSKLTREHQMLVFHKVLPMQIMNLYKKMSKKGGGGSGGSNTGSGKHSNDGYKSPAMTETDSNHDNNSSPMLYHGSALPAISQQQQQQVSPSGSAKYSMPAGGGSTPPIPHYAAAPASATTAASVFGIAAASADSVLGGSFAADRIIDNSNSAYYAALQQQQQQQQLHQQQQQHQQMQLQQQLQMQQQQQQQQQLMLNSLSGHRRSGYPPTAPAATATAASESLLSSSAFSSGGGSSYSYGGMQQASLVAVPSTTVAAPAPAAGYHPTMGNLVYRTSPVTTTANTATTAAGRSSNLMMAASAGTSSLQQDNSLFFGLLSATIAGHDNYSQLASATSPTANDISSWQQLQQLQQQQQLEPPSMFASPRDGLTSSTSRRGLGAAYILGLAPATSSSSSAATAGLFGPPPGLDSGSLNALQQQQQHQYRCHK